jgi:outer membrane receptor protein involved in Fe transport
VRGRCAAAAGALLLGCPAGAVGAAEALSPPVPPASGPLETIVVTASRTEQPLIDAPAAVTVLSSRRIRQLPRNDYADLLRSVPGVNVAQTSARDVNVTARGATSTLATSQLLLVDGRSVYLDFFGFVMWDLLPLQPNEIERIEVVRGPGSAVWGANAMTGVVNVITKRPKDLIGTTLSVGTTPDAALVHAGVSGKLGYEISAGYVAHDAYTRPAGVIPGSVPAQAYPDLRNRGTKQSRVNARLERHASEDRYVSFAAGTTRTGGILHSGIGPFDIGDGSALSYLQADWHKDAAHVAFFANFLNGHASNLLTLGADGLPLSFRFVTKTYSLRLSNASGIGRRHTLMYGADYRISRFRLGLAPTADGRSESGAYLQDQLRIGPRLRWILGTRYDRIDPLHEAVLTPRTSLLVRLSPRHVLRLSYDEAFRTPSVVNRRLDATILQPVGAFFVPATAKGNDALGSEHLKSYELGWRGVVGGGPILTAAVYRNEIDGALDFFVSRTYGPGHLPTPGANLPAAVASCFETAPGTGPAGCPLNGLAEAVPSDYGYRNLASLVNRGLELSLERTVGPWNVFANLSWQDGPSIAEAGAAADVNVPPRWRANLGVGRDVGGRFWSITVGYQGEAYWADVLDARGTTSSFTEVDMVAGKRLLGRHLLVEVEARNLFDARVQQHVFGDILSRTAAARVSYRF